MVSCSCTSAVLVYLTIALSFVHECHGYSKKVEVPDEIIRKLRDDVNDLKSVVRLLGEQNIEYAEKIKEIESIIKQCPENNANPGTGGDSEKDIKGISKTIFGNISALESEEEDGDAKLTGNLTGEQSSLRQSRLLIGNASPKPAFYATLPHDLLSISRSTIVKFSHVITNIGNVYSPHTGIFTAFQSGTFVFSVTFTVPDHSSGYLAIVRNSEYLISVGESSETQFEVISGTIVVQLNSHDSVYVKTLGFKDTSLVHNGASFTTFSGWEI